ncbi:beta-ribofuranosylaminobenzene 5'-phosphate synthase family protein [Paraburkholderia sp.]|uniref:beta-ribofuranosylaminobenzene 5'-phosphate synthase family protein n=1 Tax=Paraburkholderia sp. TaxID=1926495 RepID=UPI0023881FC3|nr:beta-ribofuranosylaminobenzene 5'-phosphate synthase family protein [Paraburkholderia sp.]MDE1179146.1 beta-ribofuranosylaminobenzene 5'-phosphate synthase [Paraburkholderia sp.]
MQIPTGNLAPLPAVTVDAPARLHLGFLDPNGTLGRPFGSIGVTVDGRGTRLTMRRAAQTRIEGARSDAELARIEQYLALLRAQWNGPQIAVELLRAPRAHTGLGSGTQLALAIGTAYARLAGKAASTAELAHLLGRGARSGIGILGFDHGGLIVDGGPGPHSHSDGAGLAEPHVPPLLFRQPFPDAWRILLIDDTHREGLHGDSERRGLAALSPFPETLAAHLCHLVLLRVLPGIAEGDFDAFAGGITELQQTIGEYFAPVQGGVFASPAVATALDAVALTQAAGIGQTSWGPTGFAFLRDQDDASRALGAAQDATRGMPGIVCSVVTGRNRGATLRAVDLQQCGVDAG